MKIIATVIITILVLIAAGIGFIYSGIYDVAAGKPHSALVVWTLSTTSGQSVRARAGSVKVPSDFDSLNTAKGFSRYHKICETCHGAPGVKPSEIGKGLNPKPPDLKKSAKELSPSEIFWIVKHGIKMTGMPDFGKTYSDAELWPLVAFVKRLPEVTDVEYKTMVQKAKAKKQEGT